MTQPSWGPPEPGGRPSHPEPPSYTGPISPGTGHIPSVPPPVFTGDVAPLDHWRPPPPGSPPPHPAGLAPPPPPKKSSSGAVIGMVVGLAVLLLCAGVAVVGVSYFTGDGEMGRKDVYPQAYDRRVEQAPPGMFVYDSDVDFCEVLPTDDIEATVGFDSGPSMDGIEWSQTSGVLTCNASMRGTEPHGDSVPVGILTVQLAIHQDVSAAEQSFNDAVEVQLSFDTASEVAVDGLVDPAVAVVDTADEGIDAYVFVRNGNLSGRALLGWSVGDTFVEPDRDVMVDMVVDMLNAAMLHLL